MIDNFIIAYKFAIVKKNEKGEGNFLMDYRIDRKDDILGKKPGYTFQEGVLRKRDCEVQ
jgi:hypothetical protein